MSKATSWEPGPNPFDSPVESDASTEIASHQQEIHEEKTDLVGTNPVYKDTTLNFSRGWGGRN